MIFINIEIWKIKRHCSHVESKYKGTLKKKQKQTNKQTNKQSKGNARCE